MSAAAPRAAAGMHEECSMKMADVKQKEGETLSNENKILLKALVRETIIRMELDTG